MTLWLGAWLIAGIAGMVNAATGSADTPGDVNTALPWFVWGLGALIVLFLLSWQLFGREIISIDDRGLSRSFKLFFFSRRKNYLLSEMQRLRWQEQTIGFTSLMFAPSIFSSAKYGALYFDYGAKTISFANGVDSGEGHYILEGIEAGVSKIAAT